MDYEKAYKESLELARDYYKANIKLGKADENLVLEDIFPELAESEDEKIRKEFCEDIWTYIPNEKAHKYIAWLEKQGEQKETLCDKCKKEQPSHSCQDITALGRCAMEKQVEQKPDDKIEPTDYNSIDPHFGKPTDKIEPKFKVKYAGSEYNVLEIKEIAGDAYYGIEDEPNHIDYVLPDNCEIVSEQKPAWSKEDEEMFAEAISVLLASSCSYDDIKKVSVWLRTIKQRMGG